MATRGLNNVSCIQNSCQKDVTLGRCTYILF